MSITGLTESPAAVGPAPATARRCRNCEVPLRGPYCSECGQKDLPPDPTLREIAADAWESLTDVDGKILVSLKLLVTKPGALTAEYLAGRRARHLPPFRLYLICSVAFFLVTSLDIGQTPAGEQRPAAVAADSATVPAQGDSSRARMAEVTSRFPLVRRIALGSQRLEESGRDTDEIIRENIPNAMFVVMPLYAMLVMLLYRSRRVRFPAHLVFALHVHAFFFATLAAMEAAETAILVSGLPDGIDDTFESAGLLAMLWYYPVAMRRVYGGRWIPTVLRAFALVTLYGAVALAIVAGAAVGYLWVLGG